MARDADDDYYYDEGTLNEHLDDFGVYEKDGRVHLHHKPTDNTVDFDDLATVLEQRTTFTEEELAGGETALYVANGDGNADAGDFVLATGSGTDDGSVISERTVDTTTKT